MKPYTVQLEISGPTAMWTRPDTGSSPVSYVAPTFSAVNGLFEAVVEWETVKVGPVRESPTRGRRRYRAEQVRDPAGPTTAESRPTVPYFTTECGWFGCQVAREDAHWVVNKSFRPVATSLSTFSCVNRPIPLGKDAGAAASTSRLNVRTA